MIIGIVGTADRRSFWEQQLRKIPDISEVIHTDTIAAVGNADVCILLEGSAPDALKSIKMGYHTYWVSRLFSDIELARSLQQTAEESGVRFMLSNWSVFSGLSKWMHDQIPQPESIHCSRTMSWEKFRESTLTIHNLWMDELSLCLKWSSSTIHRMDVNAIPVADDALTNIDIFLRFENSSTASIRVSLAGDKDEHTRQITGNGKDIWCNVNTHIIRQAHVDPSLGVHFKNMPVPFTEPAQQSIVLFFDAIKKGNLSPYNGTDLLRFSKAAALVFKHISSRTTTE